jgi:hypothetical protein
LGFSPDESYWLLHAFGKTPNISHATTTGLESAGKKQLNPTVPELIENILDLGIKSQLKPENMELIITKEHGWCQGP